MPEVHLPANGSVAAEPTQFISEGLAANQTCRGHSLHRAEAGKLPTGGLEPKTACSEAARMTEAASSRHGMLTRSKGRWVVDEGLMRPKRASLADVLDDVLEEVLQSPLSQGARGSCADFKGEKARKPGRGCKRCRDAPEEA
jgi:hypothetical protein